MRISDWSSDVCSSDLLHRHLASLDILTAFGEVLFDPYPRLANGRHIGVEQDRKRVVEGKSVSVRVDLGSRRFIQKTKKDMCSTGRRRPWPSGQYYQTIYRPKTTT